MIVARRTENEQLNPFGWNAWHLTTTQQQAIVSTIIFNAAAAAASVPATQTAGGLIFFVDGMAIC